jgi:D-alanyl-D-alanine carboxypeptidase
MTQNTPSSRRFGRTALPLVAAAVLAGAVSACSVSAGSATATSARTGAAQIRAAQARQLDRLAQQDVNAGAPGVIVRVSDGSGPAIQVARQAAFTRAARTLTPRDQFRMGSNTKTMVAALVLQLVAEHRVSLGDPISKWLPGMIPGGQAITVRMLLNHTSGLFNYINDPAVLVSFAGQNERQWTPQQLLAAGVSHHPLFRPGQEYSYSNTNYVALGLLLEKATGRSLAALIQDRIARPLGLKNTYLDTRTPASARTMLAHGYEPDAARIAPLLPPGTPPGSAFAGPRSGDFVDTTWNNTSTEWAAGGVVSTAADWSRFLSALMSGQLLPAAQLKEMETTVSEGPSTKNRYGLGLERILTPCGAVWGHVGQVPGYSSEEYTNSTGTRTASIFTSTIFGLAVPVTHAADQALQDAAVCVMLGKPVPASSSATPAS